MPALDRAQVLHIAKLARLSLREEEIADVAAQLTKILGYVDLLSEVSTDGVEPTAQLGVDRMPLRADVPQASLPRDVVLAGAPDSAGGGFVVPSFVAD